MTSPSNPDATPGQVARTTFGHLAYRIPPAFDFARLVEDLDDALSGLDVSERRVAWDHDDVALIDIGASRVALAIQDGGRRRATILTVAVGEGPGHGDLRLAERRDALARLIAGRVADRFPPVRTIWAEGPETATAEALDDRAAALAERLGQMAAPPRPSVLPPAVVSKARAARARVMRSLDAQAVMPALFERADAAMAARGVGPGQAMAAANDVPDLPPAQAAGLRSVRSALYAGPEDHWCAPPPAIRLAAHALDAALMMVLLPVGVGMMAYSLARGADLKASGRVLALCGIGIGAMDAVGGLEGLEALGTSLGATLGV